MAENSIIIGNQFISNLINDSLNNLSRGNGSILLISGESGFGKTHILNYIYDKYKQKSNYKTVITETQSPIGNFNLGNLQPLFSFSKAIEKILHGQEITPEKRFAKNLSLTVLASIPVIDSVFYAVKEISKDWKQFKQEKSNEKIKNSNAVINDYYDTLVSLSHQVPLFILIDDIHWADPMSVELLSVLAENISEHPIFIMISYKKSNLETNNLPFNTFTYKYKSTKGINFVDIETLTLAQISELSSNYFDNYKQNIEFEKWIYEKSLGVPGIANEYLKYFSKYSPFDSKGELATNFEGNEFLPSSLQSVFSQHIDILSEEERNILAVCSAEGVEFSALIVSQLMNVDLLTCIKKLKQLQTKTGIIKSLGARTKYGVKTTIYKFTQQFYHSYFENSLEYEEYAALHTQITNLLKEKYEKSNNEILKEEIAPYLVAHSMASGDEETAKSMLLATAQYAEKYGNNEIIQNAYNQFSIYNQQNENDNLRQIEFLELIEGTESLGDDLFEPHFTSENSYDTEFTKGFVSEIFDFKLYRKSIENDIINDKLDSAISKSIHILEKYESSMNEIEKLQINLLLTKSYIETSNFIEAEKIVNYLENSIDNFNNEQLKCLIYNISAQYYLHIENLPKAYYSLDKATNLLNYLPYELRLLTLANIGILKKKTNNEKSREYLISAKNLSNYLNFNKLYNDFNDML